MTADGDEATGKTAPRPPGCSASVEEALPFRDTFQLGRVREPPPDVESEAAREAEARELDNQALRTQVRELRAKLGERETHVASLEQERLDAQTRIAALEAEVAGLQKQLAERKRDNDVRADLLATMREMIEGQSKGAEAGPGQILPN